MMHALIVAMLLLAGAERRTQLEENDAACAKTKIQQRKLDESLRELFRRAQKDKGLTARITKAQDSWLKFKELQLRALYGSADPLADYGSVWPMCDCIAEEELVNERLAQVQRMVTFVDGDLCGWSRP